MITGNLGTKHCVFVCPCISHPHMGVKTFKKVFHKSIFYTRNEFLRRKVQIPRHFFCKPLYKSQFRALDKREYLTIDFACFSLKPYDVTPHLNHLDETVQMRGHNICFNAEVAKIIPNYHQLLPLIWSCGQFSSDCIFSTLLEQIM